MTQERTRVLVADDEESIRSLLERFLTEAGYQVVTAANGREALDKLSQAKVDLALFDIKMPVMSGMEALEQISAKCPEVCVVMATAVVDTQTAIEAMKLGAYDYIIKPFNRDDLLLKIQKALGKKQLEMENERHELELRRRLGEQAQRLQEQFVDLVETLSREHKLIYKLASKEKGGKEALANLPKELQEPMVSVEQFSEALLKLMRGGLANWSRARRIDKG